MRLVLPQGEGIWVRVEGGGESKLQWRRQSFPLDSVEGARVVVGGETPGKVKLGAEGEGV